LRGGWFWWLVLLFGAWLGILVFEPRVIVEFFGEWPTATPGWSYFVSALMLTTFTIALHFMALAAANPDARTSPRRGMFFLVIGEDGRVSTSKVQLVFWTYAIAFVFLSLVLQGLFDADVTLDEQYLLLLGIPTAGVAGAKLITTRKVETGTIEKSDVADSTVTIESTSTVPIDGEAATAVTVEESGEPAETPSLANALGQAVSDDEGRGDIGDLQYLVFNVVALVYFFTDFFSSGGGELPTVPPTIVALTGASALAYLTKKGVVNDVPVITSVFPSKAKEGEYVVIRGHHFTAGGTGPRREVRKQVQVMIGGRPALNTHAPTPTIVHAEVPPGVVGTHELTVVTPGGLQAEPVAFEVFEQIPSIRSVTPTKIVLAKDDDIEIRGTYFREADDAGASVELGGRKLRIVGDHTATSITARIPANAKSAIGIGQRQLVVKDARGRTSDGTAIEIG
jgi:hypothetical protein